MNQLHPLFADILQAVQAAPAAIRAAEIPVPAPRWPRPSTVALYGSNPHGASSAAAHQAAIDREAEERDAADEWIERRAEQIMKEVAGSDLAASTTLRSGRVVREGQPVDELTEALFGGEDIDGMQIYSMVRRALVWAAKAHVSRGSQASAGDMLKSAMWSAACDRAEQEYMRRFA